MDTPKAGKVEIDIFEQRQYKVDGEVMHTAHEFVRTGEPGPHNILAKEAVTRAVIQELVEIEAVRNTVRRCTIGRAAVGGAFAVATVGSSITMFEDNQISTPWLLTAVGFGLASCSIFANLRNSHMARERKVEPTIELHRTRVNELLDAQDRFTILG